MWCFMCVVLAKIFIIEFMEIMIVGVIPNSEELEILKYFDSINLGLLY